jgi:hypothetical protein
MIEEEVYRPRHPLTEHDLIQVLLRADQRRVAYRHKVKDETEPSDKDARPVTS